eukprot:SAG31_NODE_141_length_22675_cov_48.948879_2_plen_84_part_00
MHEQLIFLNVTAEELSGTGAKRWDTMLRDEFNPPDQPGPDDAKPTPPPALIVFKSVEAAIKHAEIIVTGSNPVQAETNSFHLF